MRPSYFDLLNLELHEECSRTLGPGMGWNLPEQLGLQADVCNQGAVVEADAIRELQLKQTQLGSSS